jgi:hypothetical protein
MAAQSSKFKVILAQSSRLNAEKVPFELSAFSIERLFIRILDWRFYYG